MDYEEQEAYDPYPGRSNNSRKQSYNPTFSRINPDEVGPIRAELRDNSFQAKGRYG